MIVKRVEWSGARTLLDFYSQITQWHYSPVSISTLQCSVPGSHPNQLRRLLYISRIFCDLVFQGWKHRQWLTAPHSTWNWFQRKSFVLLRRYEEERGREKDKFEMLQHYLQGVGGEQKIGSKYPAVKHFHQIFIKSLIFRVVKQWIYT